jgi:sugar phosphate isomerase/epimerase
MTDDERESYARIAAVKPPFAVALAAAEAVRAGARVRHAHAKENSVLGNWYLSLGGVPDAARAALDAAGFCPWGDFYPAMRGVFDIHFDAE